jgi:thiamine pyrophosphokinase
MSSHHIVLDSQEAALIVANGESCSNELLDQLLEWSPFTLVLDGALERYMSLNKVFDVFLGDFDNRDLTKIREQLPSQIQIEHMPDQESSDLEKGIEFLIKDGHRAVNIVWATGRRSDHFLNNISILARYSDRINLVMIDDHSVIYPVKSGFKKYYKKGTLISLMPLTKVTNLVTNNLVWNSKGQTYEFPFNGSSSNEAALDGVVEVNYDSGVLLLMECRD